MSDDDARPPTEPVLVIVDEPGTPRFHVQLVCPRCEAVLHARTYHVRATTPDEAGDEAVAHVSRALAHVCRGN